MRWVGTIGAWVLLGLWACGTELATNIEETPLGAGDGGSESGATSSGGGALDGSAVVDASEASGDPPPPTGGNGTIDPCAESYKPGSSDVYVTTTGSDEKDCGSPAKPCSLERALDGTPQTINVADGQYVLPVKLTSRSIRVFGGWKPDASGWKRTCEVGKVQIVSPDAFGIVINDSAVTLSYVDVSSKATAAEGESLYGMMVTGRSRVTLDHVNVRAAAGGFGVDGATRNPATQVASCSAPSDGAPGGNGAGGQDGKVRFATSGIEVVSKPTDGGGGIDGHAGTQAPKPEAPGYTGHNCVSDTVIEGASSGGPIGLGCHAVDCQHRITGDMGTNGCGGVGGAAGLAGTNAGSSIGLYVTGSSTVSVVEGSLTSGNGGNGGKGSEGGAGAPGSNGAPGADRADVDCSDDNLACDSLSTVQCQKGQNPMPFMAPGGAAGGNGGPGGSGGKGGTGAGGHSFAFVNGLSSSVELSKTAPVLTNGSAGTGAGPAGAGISHSFKELE